MNHSVALARRGSPLLGVLVWTVVPLALLGSAWLPLDEPMPLPVSILFTLLAIGLAVLFIWLPQRLAYTLTEGGLEIRRASGTFVWPYRDLQASATSSHLGFKQGGVDVPGYYSGVFAWSGGNPKTVLALSSTTRNGVLVSYQGKLYFLTPADPQAFLRELWGRGAAPT